jgi:hypothetical protein
VFLTIFILIGVNEIVSFVRFVSGKVLANLTTCGMYYLGQAGVANYTSIYDVSRIPFGGNGDLFSAQASPPKTLGVVRGLLNNHQK